MPDQPEFETPKSKVDEAREILRLLGMPVAQQGERSGLVLLALANMHPHMDWSDATNPQMGVTPIMLWVGEVYGRVYAVGTRETFRRQTLHQMMSAGICLYDPDVPLATNSSLHVYQLPAEILPLLRAYGTDDWPGELDMWHELAPSLTERWAAHRDTEMIPVTLPDGTTVELSGGGQNPLIAAVVEAFGPTFVPGGHVLYLGDTDEKFIIDHNDVLIGLGVNIEEHGKMPDVVLYDAGRNWLVLIEAVTSHGPINPLRKEQLEALFGGSTAGLVFVTTFEDRQTWRKYAGEIAWETEVWIAEDPSHLIHYNGDKFLGPH
jgi:hypothetical protein